MLKSMSHSFHNFRCGEVVCITPTEYSVECCLCGQKINFEEFPKHFREKHIGIRDNEQKPDYTDDSYHESLFRIKAPDNVLSEKYFMHNDDNEVDGDEELAFDVDDDQVVAVQCFAAASDDVDGEKPILLTELTNEAETTVIEKQRRLADNHTVAEQEDEDDVPLAQRKKAKQWASKWEKANKSEVKRKQGKMKLASDKKLSKADLSTKLDANTDQVIVLQIEPQNSLCSDNDNDINEYDAQAEELLDYSDEDNEIDADTPYACSKCHMKFKNRRSLCGHLNKHRNPALKQRKPKAFKCNECDETFHSENFLRSHMYKHTGIVCDICGNSFTQVGNLMRHKIRHTGIKSHKCELCDYKSYTDKELKAHMMRHTGVLPHICEICGKRCRDRGKLSEHMRRHTGERPFKCPTCGKCFFSGHDLNVHSLSHTDHRPFVCNQCGARAKSKKSIARAQKAA